MRPFTLLIKPAGPDCNLACRYCFYSSKTSLFGKGTHRMTDSILETLVRSYLQLDLPHYGFAFQGGEPTLMGLDFFRRVVELQRKFGRPGQTVSNSLQTNAVLLDDDWCRFLGENNFLVGISLDGPKKYHDHYRVDHAGKGTFDRVLAAIERCRRHNVQFNVLVLLNNLNVVAPDEVLDFFLEHKIKFLQFVPCVERDETTGEIADFSITAEQYGDFLCRVFDRWQQFGPQKLSIRIFDSILLHCLGRPHSECTFGKRCSDYIVIEHNGDAFCCDFFVEERWRLGNITETPIEKLASGSRKREFARNKMRLADKCLICKYLDVCRGGCVKDRLARAGRCDAPSYFCEGYRRFFDHALDRLWQMAATLTEKPTPAK